MSRSISPPRPTTAPPPLPPAAATRSTGATPPRAADTLKNLGAELPATRDDAKPAVPRPSSPFRSRVPTLIFHGLPTREEAQSTMLPPPPTPRRPIADLIAQELESAPTRPRFVELLCADLRDADLRDDEATDDACPVGDLHERSTPMLVRTSSARSDRPPAYDATASWTARAPLIAGALAHIAVAAAMLGAAGAAWRASAPPADRLTPSAIDLTMAGAFARAASEAARPRGCVAGPSRVVTPHAMLSAGVQTTVLGDRLALGVLAAPHEARAFEIDPASLRVLGTAKLQTLVPLRRALPELRDGDPIDVLPDSSPEPSRRALVEATGEHAVAMRQGNAVWIGVARDAHAAPDRGSLVRVSASSRRAGAPAVASLGDRAIASWAELDETAMTWKLHGVIWRLGAPPPPARDFALPSGGLGVHAMSASLAPLDGGRAVIAWTEGPVAQHQVRAQLLDADGAPIGDAVTLSPEGVSSGQGQIAMNRAGRGLVAFFARDATATGFELRATELRCE